MVKAYESVHKHRKKVNCAAKEHRRASDVVAKTRLAFRAASPGSSKRDALKLSLEQAKQVVGRAAEKAAIAKANMRTAKAQARAVEFAEAEKLRKRKEKVKRKEAARDAKRAKKYAIKLSGLVSSSGDNDKKIAAAVAENAKATARRTTKARKKRI